MRAVTLLNLAAVQDPTVRAALDEIQKASQDNVISDVANSGAALSTIKNAAADTMPYFTGADTADTTALTAYARTFLAAADAAAAVDLLDIPTGVYLLIANDLSDLHDPAAARGNLELGSAAQLAAGAVLQTANNLSDVPVAATARTNIGAAATAQTDFISGIIKLPANQDYRIIESIPYGATITSFVAKTSTGTVSAALEINTTAITAGSLSVTSTQGTTAPTAANVMVANDALVMTLSSASAAKDLSFTIEFTRALS